jgi:hypothetical protein
MRGRVAPFVVPTMVHATKQTIKAPQMTYPQERQLKEQKHKVKREHDPRFLKGEEHLSLDGDIYKD